MKFIYATDLHGDMSKYEKLYHFSKKHDIKLIHIGADILPKGSHLYKIQKNFINKLLKDWYFKCKEDNIDVIGFFGNDDIYTRKKYIKKYMSLLDEKEFKYQKYVFDIAYQFVGDYPFGLKTACKKDSCQSEIVEYISVPLEVNDCGFYKIENIKKYFKDKGTIKDDLKNKSLKNSNQTIASFHMPPHKCGLDVCYGYNCVGSKVIFEWILREQPLLFLCGHIHESPEVTGVWHTKLGNTLVVQPGNKNFVYFEINKSEIKKYLIKF